MRVFDFALTTGIKPAVGMENARAALEATLPQGNRRGPAKY